MGLKKAPYWFGKTTGKRYRGYFGEASKKINSLIRLSIRTMTGGPLRSYCRMLRNVRRNPMVFGRHPRKRNPSPPPLSKRNLSEPGTDWGGRGLWTICRPMDNTTSNNNHPRACFCGAAVRSATSRAFSAGGHESTAMATPGGGRMGFGIRGPVDQPGIR